MPEAAGVTIILPRLQHYFLCAGLFASLIVFSGPGHAQTRPLQIVATGDMMIGSWVGTLLDSNGYDYPFREIYTATAGADIYFTNLEAPFCTKGTPFEKQFNFRVHPRYVEVLTTGGINLVSLANNHSMDFGFECLKQTFALLDRHHIDYAGAGINLDQAREPALMQFGDMSVAFLSYSLTFPEEFWASDTSAGTAFPYESFVYKDVARLKAENDYLIVSCHWGQELRETPKRYQIQFAHQLVDKGADLVLGHHPHVVQGIEFYKEGLIVYSLGNFIFGSFSERVRSSMILKIALAPTGVSRVEAVPINVYNKDVRFQPALLGGTEKEDFLNYLGDLSQELNADSISIKKSGVIEINKTSLTNNL